MNSYRITDKHTYTHLHASTQSSNNSRDSIQHLADRYLSPTTSLQLPFTGPQCCLMDHLQPGMDRASSPHNIPHPFMPFHPVLSPNPSSSGAICYVRWPCPTFVVAYGHTNATPTHVHSSRWAAGPSYIPSSASKCPCNVLAF